jgi:hypothetical protein
MEESTQNLEAANNEDMSRQPFAEPQYTLDVYQASALFSEAAVPRSPRTVERYCKSGHLVCKMIDTERNEKYLITRESVIARIKELQQAIPSGHLETERDMSRHVETQRDMSRHDATRDEISDDEKLKLEERIKELERENLDLKIANRGKDYFLDEVKKDKEKEAADRKDMIQQLIEQSFRIGELEGIITHAQIEAPRREQPKIAEQQSNVIDVTPENTSREEIEEESNNLMQ